MPYDLTRLGAWAELPFFRDRWPGIETALAAEPGPVLPPEHLRFRALETLPPDRVRVVILGQDPYPQPGKADGLAFSVPDGVAARRPDSLSRILAEVASDTGRPRGRTDLSDWAAQGVLLLNTALSVREGQAGSHRGLGWRHLVVEVLGRLGDRPRAFLLWGDQARGFRDAIGGEGHLVIESGHPSPLATRSDFPGSRPFARVNDWLVARGEPPLRWT